MRARRARGVTLLEMLIVVTIVALLAGLTYPGVTAGLGSIRLRTAGDSLASFLTAAMDRVERTQLPVEIVVHKAAGRLEALSPDAAARRELVLPDGVSVLAVHPEPPAALGDAPATRSLVLLPGAPFPRVAIELMSRRGARKVVRIDPLSGAAVVENVRPDVSEEEQK